MFTSEDLKMYKQLETTISKNANWTGTTKEVIDIYRQLVWFAGLAEKIEKSIFEIKSVKQVNKTEAPESEVTE